jgi:hypothetical protein
MPGRIGRASSTLACALPRCVLLLRLLLLAGADAVEGIQCLVKLALVSRRHAAAATAAVVTVDCGTRAGDAEDDAGLLPKPPSAPVPGLFATPRRGEGRRRGAAREGAPPRDGG